MRPSLFLVLFFVCCSGLQAGEASDYSSVIESTRALARELVGDGSIPGVSIAFVDGDRVVWADGFGLADLEKRTATNAATVYRVGSISKVFTALGVMQLVEKGKVDLDRPLAEYLPDLGVENPFLAEAGPVKPRHVFSHVSGMPRESPVGSYFDGSGATPAQALASLRGQRLVHPPGRVTKYSNAAVSLMGNLIERVSGVVYEEYESQNLLGPLGMKSSAFAKGPKVNADLATGYMQERDRRLTRAPVFELATVAAGNLYSSVEDLSRLARMLHAGGEIDGHRIVETKTLEAMWTKQFPDAGRFGIGFSIGERFGEKSVEHNGAVYGFSSVFICVPAAKVSVILLANEDIAFGSLKRLTDRLLGGALAMKRGGKPPAESEPSPLARGFIPGSAGAYRSETSRIELRAEGLGTTLIWNGHSVRLKPTESCTSFITRDRLMDGNEVIVEIDSKEKVTAVLVDKTRFLPFDSASAPMPRKEWDGIAGDYGPAYLPVRISIRDGRVVAECETFEYEPTPRDDGSFVFPKGTLYEDEALRFHRDPDGKASAISLGTMRFERLRKG